DGPSSCDPAAKQRTHRRGAQRGNSSALLCVLCGEFVEPGSYHDCTYQVTPVPPRRCAMQSGRLGFCPALLLIGAMVGLTGNGSAAQDLSRVPLPEGLVAKDIEPAP